MNDAALKATDGNVMSVSRLSQTDRWKYPLLLDYAFTREEKAEQFSVVQFVQKELTEQPRSCTVQVTWAVM